MNERSIRRTIKYQGFEAYLEADFGKVFISVGEPQMVEGRVARELGSALKAMADMADAQMALRRARDEYGTNSKEAQTAEDHLAELKRMSASCNDVE